MKKLVKILWGIGENDNGTLNVEVYTIQFIIWVFTFPLGFTCMLIMSGLAKKDKPTRTVITRDEINAYAAATPHIRNSVKKTQDRETQQIVSEQKKSTKRTNKNKAAKQARKKSRR